MTHHPALKWVSNANSYRRAPGVESHVFDGLTDDNFDAMIERSLPPYGEDKFAKTAPEASETDKVIDCELCIEELCTFDDCSKRRCRLKRSPPGLMIGFTLILAYESQA